MDRGNGTERFLGTTDRSPHTDQPHIAAPAQKKKKTIQGLNAAASAIVSTITSVYCPHSPGMLLTLKPSLLHTSCGDLSYPLKPGGNTIFFPAIYFLFVSPLDCELPRSCS